MLKPVCNECSLIRAGITNQTRIQERRYSKGLPVDMTEINKWKENMAFHKRTAH